VLDLLRVTSGAEPFGQIEKFPFLPLAGLDALLDQFHQNTVIAETPLLRYRPHLPGNVGRQRHASTHVSSRGSFGHCHCTIIHHIDAQLLVHSSCSSSMTAAEDLLKIVMRRYERASTLLISNRPVDDWGKLLGDSAAVTAMLDRLLHHGHVLKCGPRSWRTKTDLPPQEASE
jgi:hypothetical protein